jgi:integrase
MTVLFDAAGRPRSPATLPGYHAGRPPRNKGMRYPADPPTVDEIVADMRHTSDGRHGWRARAMIAVLWRVELPLGPLLCIIDGPTRGRPWSGAAVRGEFRRIAARAGVRRRFAPHQLRHAHALELAREGVPLNIIQRQLGHANLGTTSIYLQGIDPEEIITAVRARRAPMMSASAGLRL